MNEGNSWIHGQNLIRVANLKVLSRKSLHYRSYSRRDAHIFTCAGHIRDFYCYKERSHIANAHLKIIR